MNMTSLGVRRRPLGHSGSQRGRFGGGASLVDTGDGRGRSQSRGLSWRGSLTDSCYFIVVISFLFSCMLRYYLMK